MPIYFVNEARVWNVRSRSGRMTFDVMIKEAGSESLSFRESTHDNKRDATARAEAVVGETLHSKLNLPVTSGENLYHIYYTAPEGRPTKQFGGEKLYREHQIEAILDNLTAEGFTASAKLKVRVTATDLDDKKL